MTQSADSAPPLIVDLDGTLVATDTLLESLWAGLGIAPLAVCGAVLRNLRNRPALKARLAAIATPEIASLPLRHAIIELMDAALVDNRQVFLASGADQTIVDAMGARLGLPGPHLGSSPGTNLTGITKAAALEARFGAAGFDYVGDSHADLPVWAAARQGYVVSPGMRLGRAIAKSGLQLTKINLAKSPWALLRAMRPHQWVKNALLFLPVLAAHQFDMTTFGAVLLGAVAFSAAASSIYIVNDLLDLAADRQHAEKRYRPFAAGTAPIAAGMALSFGLALLALGLAALLTTALVGVVIVYMALSLGYSLRLKRLRWIDVLVLASLYTLRVVAGSLAGGLALSGWLANFIFPVFLALGCVKRLTELARAPAGQRLAGRGYAPEDRGDLRNIAIASTVAASLVFLAYSFSSVADALYAAPWLLRLATIIIPIWLGRMIIRGWQGRMNHDPIVFALRDLYGLGLLAIAMVLVLFAAGLI